MTEQEVLELALQKAHDNGFRGVFPDWIYSAPIADDVSVVAPWFIYSHSFAKALFGTHEHEQVLGDDAKGKYSINEPCWQYHLKQMVISPDPIKYLQENM